MICIYKMSGHGGSYPAAERGPNAGSSLGANDWCMSVGVMARYTAMNGFTQNGHGNDAPSSDTDYPNAAYTQNNHVNVWIK